MKAEGEKNARESPLQIHPPHPSINLPFPSSQPNRLARVRRGEEGEVGVAGGGREDVEVACWVVGDLGGKGGGGEGGGGGGGGSGGGGGEEGGHVLSLGEGGGRGGGQ